jgi:large subunit ribosomal protein L9
MTCSGNPLLCLPELTVYQQLRTTFILKRRWPAALVKKGRDPSSKRLRARNFVYDLVEDTNVRKQKDLEVILTDFVAGIGNRGDRITMKQNAAYHKLLLPGLAVYASPENIEQFTHLKNEVGYRPKYSSPFVEKTVKILQHMNVVVLMNSDVPWTIEPWHVRMSFRKAGIHVPEDAISLPEEPICGPNMEMENKFFEVTVTINNTEKVPVKCVIHHWSTHVSNKLPPADEGDEPRMPLFPVVVSEAGSKASSDPGIAS